MAEKKILNNDIVSVSTGKLGVGTNAPGHKLDVRGSGYFLGDTSVPNAPTALGFYLGKSQTDENRRLEIVSPANGVSYIDFTKPNTDYRGRIAYYDNGDSFRFYTAGNEKLRIDSAGNVGIGTTSITSGYKLEVSGSILSKVASGNTSVVVATSNANGAINAIANSGLEIATDATNKNIAFRTGTSTRMYIKSDGNVGIGTTSPGAELHIYDPTLWAQIIVEAANDGYDSSVVYNQSGVTKGITGYDDSTDTVALKYGTFSGNGIDITAGGKVGIGTTDPGAKLDITTDHTSQIPIRVTHNNYNDWLIQKRRSDDTQKLGIKEVRSNGSMGFATADAVRMVIDSSGNVGIGTTSPGYKLEVIGATRIDSTLTVADTSTANSYIYLLSSTSGESELRMGDTDSDAGSIAYNNANNYMAFRANAAERMRIDSSGNVGIGTTSVSNAKLKVAGGGVDIESSTDSLRLRFYEGTTFRSGFQQVLNVGEMISGSAVNDLAIRANSGNMLFAAGGSSERMRIDSAGNVGIGTTSPGYPLDVNGIIRSENASEVGTLYLGNTAQSQIPGGAIIGQRSSYSSTGKMEFKVPTWGAGTDYGLTTQMTIEVNASDTKQATISMIPFGGNVGIGTTAPGDYYSDKLVVNAGNEDGITIVGGTSDINYLMFADGTVGNARYRGMLWYNHSTDTMVLATSGSNRINIDSSGNVGIGTTSPSQKLDVAGSIRQEGAYVLNISDGANVVGSNHLYLAATNSYITLEAANNSIYYKASAGHSFQDASGNERVKITAAGNVGIGTTTISGQEGAANGTPKLQVLKTGTTGSYDLVARFGTDQDESNSGASVLINGGNDRGLLVSAGRADSNRAVAHLNLIQYDGNELTDGLTIYQPNAGSSGATSGTNVGIGTASPSSKLEVAGDVEFTQGLKFSGFAPTSTELLTVASDGTVGKSSSFYSAGDGLDLTGTVFSVESDLSGDVHSIGRDANDKYVINTSNHAWYLDGVLDMRLANNGTLDVDGDVVAYSTVTNSDRRLKKDISTIENASEKVSQLRGVEYTWNHGKRTGTKDIGLIAQEVEEVIPEVVTTGELLDGTEAKRVDYGKLVGLLIESNKELQERIKTLEEKLDGINK